MPYEVSLLFATSLVQMIVSYSWVVWAVWMIKRWIFD